MAPRTSRSEAFEAAVARQPTSGLAIFWPDTIVLNQREYRGIQHPSSHVFAATRATLPLLRAACQSPCLRLLPRLLALNPQVVGVPIPTDYPPVVNCELGAVLPVCRYPVST